MMTFTLFPVSARLGAMYLSAIVGAIGLGAITLTSPVGAESVEAGARDLLLPEEKTEPFEYNTDDLDQLSTQINHSVEGDREVPIRVIRNSQDTNAPTSDAGLIINSDGVVGAGEVSPR